MILESKPKPLKENVNIKISQKTNNLINNAVSSANKLIEETFDDKHFYTKASMIRDIVETAIMSDIKVLKIENKSFSIKELVELKNPTMKTTKNLLDVIIEDQNFSTKSQYLKDFLFDATRDIVYEMKEQIKNEIEEDEEDCSDIISEFNFIKDSYIVEGKYRREFSHEEDIDDILCKAQELDDFISNNNLYCDDFSKRFKFYIKYLPKYISIESLYFYDRFTYIKISRQLKVFVKLWEKFLINYSYDKKDKFSYDDFEKEVFRIMK